MSELCGAFRLLAGKMKRVSKKGTMRVNPTTLRRKDTLIVELEGVKQLFVASW